MELLGRFELPTSSLPRMRSTDWAIAANEDIFQSSCLWRPGSGSNRRPPAWQAGVLTNWTTGPYGRGRRDRTLGTRFWRPLLYQLSYTPILLFCFWHVRIFCWWAFGDSNPGPTGYEPVALTNWAKGPYTQTCLDISFAVTYFYMTANHVLAPQVGLEPTTLWLTVRCSTDWAIEEYWSDLSFLQIALCRHRPIFPGRHQPSIVSVNELNYRVRNGNGCTLITINTYCVLLSKNLCYYNTFAVLCQEKNWWPVGESNSRLRRERPSS